MRRIEESHQRIAECFAYRISPGMAKYPTGGAKAANIASGNRVHRGAGQLCMVGLKHKTSYLDPRLLSQARER